MSEFVKRETAIFSPTSCALCGDHEGPFIDTHLEWPAYGHVWLCAPNDRRSGCVSQMAILCGMYDQTAMDTVLTENEVLRARIRDLEDQLGQKRLTLKTVKEYLDG